MLITRPSDELSNKTNVNPSVNRLQEATAEDFTEIASILDEIIDEVETLSQSASANPYYNSWTSLVALQAAHPTAVANAWAIIDAGAGITPQIAAWDDSESQWELTGPSEIHIFVNTVSDLPGTGLPQKDYITLDDMVVRVWHNGEYKIKSPTTNTGSWKQKNIKVLNVDANVDPADASQGNVLFVFEDADITHIILDTQFSKIMEKARTLSSTNNFSLNIMNVTENSNLRPDITSYELVNSNSNLKIGVTGISTNEVSENDVIQIELPIKKPDYNKIGNLEYNTTNNTNPTVPENGNYFRGHPNNDSYVVGVVLDASSFDPSNPNDFDIYNKTIAKLFIDN